MSGLVIVIGSALLAATTSVPAQADSELASLDAHRALVIGSRLISPDHRISLSIDTRGTLSRIASGTLTWTSGTSTSKANARGTRLLIDEHGRVVLQRRSGRVVWRSTPVSGATRLILTNDGTLRLVAPHGSRNVLRGTPAATATSSPGSSTVPAPSVTAASQLTPLQDLRAGEQLSSDNNCFHLLLQHDGNLVLSSSTKVLWTSGGIIGDNASVTMQPDGNLVVHDSEDQPRWATQTASSGAYLVLRDDGDLVVFSTSGSALWSTKTAQADKE